VATKKKPAKKATKRSPRKAVATAAPPKDDIEAEEQMEAEAFKAPTPMPPIFVKFEIAKRIAHTLANSTLVPEAYRGRANDVFVAINMGDELGMGPFQAIQSIAVIDGSPCLYGDGLVGVVRASPKCQWIEEPLSDDGMVATCRTQRTGDPKPISASYSMEDAMTAGLNTKFNWKKHPKRYAANARTGLLLAGRLSRPAERSGDGGRAARITTTPRRQSPK